MEDPREVYCNNCASGDLDNGVYFCYQYFKKIMKITKKSDLPCRGFSNIIEDEEKKNYKTYEQEWF